MAEKAVLMSIHKNWLDKILSGEKILEIRGNYPKSAYLPFQVYLYETRNGGGCGRIRAIALCTNLFRFSKNDLESNEGDAFLKASCLTREQLTPFFSSKNVVYGWQLSDVQPLDMALDAVKTSRPPQGWQYCPIPSQLSPSEKKALFLREIFLWLVRGCHHQKREGYCCGIFASQNADDFVRQNRRRSLERDASYSIAFSLALRKDWRCACI